MSSRRYSIKESLNRILRVLQGETPNTDDPNTLSGEVYSEDFTLSHLAELLSDSLPGKSLNIPAFIGETISDLDYIEFNLNYSGGIQEGRLQWNVEDGTLDLGLPGGQVTQQIGQELPFRWINDESVDMPNGSVVRITGGQGNLAEIKFSDNSTFASAAPTIGVTTEVIEAGRRGYVTTVGLVRDVPTSDPPGTILWLGSTGTYTSTRPTSPNFQLAIGGVIRQHATEGIILVAIDRVPRLSFLSDVYINNLQHGDVLSWSTGTSRWENGAP